MPCTQSKTILCESRFKKFDTSPPICNIEHENACCKLTMKVKTGKKRYMRIRMLLVAALGMLATAVNSQTFDFSIDSAQSNASTTPGSSSPAYAYGALDMRPVGTTPIPTDLSFEISSATVSWFGTTPAGANTTFVVPPSITLNAANNWHWDGLVMSISAAPTTPLGTYYGNLTFNGAFSTGYEGTPFDGENFSLKVVPEPYEYGLLAVAGMLGLALCDRRVRKAAV
jgi:hypothetical protein